MLAFALIISSQPERPQMHLPSILWLSTGLIAVSSVVFEAARYSLRRARLLSYRKRLVAALMLGSAFIVCQFFSWERIAAQGVGMQSNPRGSAFYVFTGIHALHLFGGILGAWYILRRSSQVNSESEQSLRRQRRITGAVAMYWHSMGLLWFGLFALLVSWAGGA
jgi:cytochrome c oxidase subunit III